MATIELHPLELTFPSPQLSDPVGEMLEGLRQESGAGLPQRGSQVAILAGSRKINLYADFIAGLAKHLRGLGLLPIVVPAMGSHGGNDANGQRRVLEALGVTEEAVGAEIVCDGGVEQIGTTPGGFPVWAHRAALKASAFIPVNRVKPHTAFRGAVESGPAKMLAVGLGMEKSATMAHRAGLSAYIREIAGFHLLSGMVPLGVGVVENCFGKTAKVEILRPEGWFAGEEKLLRFAWELYPRLPWEELDLLIVERMGKDISGTGMDLNVIGMNRRFPEMECGPRIKKVVALSLTEASFGNGTGVGYADYVTQKLADAFSREVTEKNCAASGFVEAGKLPEVFPDESLVIDFALKTLGNPHNPRVARIPDTANLTKVHVSKALLDDLPQPSRRV